MKKSVLALAVTAALAGFGSAAYADTTLYGSARVSVDYIDLDTNSDGFWDLVNDSSRLGVRGQEDLGGGLSAIYQYEFGVDLTEGSTGFNGNRPKWVGLKGGFGSVTAGTQWTAYYNVTGVADIFNSAKTFATDTGYLGFLAGHRLDNTVLYTTPNLSGFTAQAMLMMNGNTATTTANSSNRFASTSDDIDLWQLGANYKNGPIYLGAAYMQLQDSNNVVGDDLQQWALVGAYQTNAFSIGLLYEQGDLNAVSTSALKTGYSYATNSLEDTTNFMLFGSFAFGNSSIRAAYGYMDFDDKYTDGTLNANGTLRRKSFEEIQTLLLGYQYDLSKRTRLWVEYLGRMNDNDDILRSVGADQDIVSIGMRHDF